MKYFSYEALGYTGVVVAEDAEMARRDIEDRDTMYVNSMKEISKEEAGMIWKYNV